MNKERFSVLAPVEWQLLAVPAISTSSEEISFSSGPVVDKLPAALSPENAEALMFLRKNAEAIGADPAEVLLKPQAASASPLAPVQVKKGKHL